LQRGGGSRGVDWRHNTMIIKKFKQHLLNLSTS